MRIHIFPGRIFQQVQYQLDVGSTISEELFTKYTRFNIVVPQKIPLRSPEKPTSQAENVGCIELPLIVVMLAYRSDTVIPIKAPVMDFFVNNHDLFQAHISIFLLYTCM